MPLIFCPTADQAIQVREGRRENPPHRPEQLPGQIEAGHERSNSELVPRATGCGYRAKMGAS